ncbi:MULTISPECIES: BrnA antitoxin family protein [unclassified Luteimonas]
MNLKTDTQALAHRAKDRRQVVHARIAVGREHAMQTLAGFVGHFGELLKTDTIRFDKDVLEAFKADGPGWQSRMNAALREWLGKHPQR